MTPIFKDYCYQYFQRKEFNITSHVMLVWHIVFKSSIDGESEDHYNKDLWQQKWDFYCNAR